mmetsp:Transcript_27575/g.67067  ORF Transcript_27575/g.67067 Transcript_27575/m.67067 type:complete len:252 (+) Transcript_27575:236-991(+)
MGDGGLESRGDIPGKQRLCDGRVVRAVDPGGAGRVRSLQRRGGGVPRHGTRRHRQGAGQGPDPRGRGERPPLCDRRGAPLRPLGRRGGLRVRRQRQGTGLVQEGVRGRHGVQLLLAGRLRCRRAGRRADGRNARRPDAEAGDRTGRFARQGRRRPGGPRQRVVRQRRRERRDRRGRGRGRGRGKRPGLRVQQRPGPGEHQEPGAVRARVPLHDVPAAGSGRRRRGRAGRPRSWSRGARRRSCGWRRAGHQQ